MVAIVLLLFYLSSLKNYNIHLLCQCVCMCVHVWVCRSEDNFLVLVLSFHHVGVRVELRFQTWQQALLLTEPSHHPASCFLSPPAL